MRNRLFFGLLAILLASPGCEKSENVQEEVDRYVEELIQGKYNSSELPDYTTDHISPLLEFREDSTLITDFPRNPLSSFWMGECRLGIFVLWTIESIRVVENQREGILYRFPSLNPVINISNPDSIKTYEISIIHQTAADAYYDWWNNDSSLTVKLEMDPLDSTGYSWH